MVRAVRFWNYGGLEVLKVEDELSEPAADEIVVQVRPTGINPGRSNIPTGALHARFPATLPSGEGSDFAGTVVGLGVAGPGGQGRMRTPPARNTA